MAQLVPIVNAGFLYANSCQVTWLSNTTLSVAAGQFRDHNNVMDLVLSAPVTINAAVNGANGLDTGVLADSTFYYVYLIGASTNNEPVAAILSKSISAPVLPFGYDSYRLISYQLTSSGGNLLLSYECGNKQARMKVWDAVISAGTASGSASLAALSLAAGVPPVNNLPVYLAVAYTANSAGNSISFATGASTSVALPGISNAITSHAQLATIKVVSTLVAGVPTIQYIDSSASDSQTIGVYGFDYYV